MRQIRIRAAVLAGWLIFFYSIERLIDPVGITSAGYIILCLVALFALLAPRWSRDLQWVIVAIPMLLFLAAKAWTGASVLGAATLLTITEAGAIVVTFLLARWVSSAINEFEDAIAHMTLGQPGPVAFKTLNPSKVYFSLYIFSNTGSSSTIKITFLFNCPWSTCGVFACVACVIV